MSSLPPSFYAAFLATLISIVGWTYLARKKHRPETPLPLSYLFVFSKRTMVYSRFVLWVCGSLFAVTLYLFILPRLHHNAYLFVAWTLAFVCEMLTGVFPAHKKTELPHNVIAFTMGFSFVAMAIIFSLVLTGAYAAVEVAVTLVMAMLGTLGIMQYRTRFLFYELPFVWLSHISILIAALAVR